MKDYCSYWLIRFLLFLFGGIPFRVLYILSNGIGFILSDVLRYRKKVIEKNLRLSFPNLSEEKIQETKMEFYKYFSDLLLESFYSFSMTLPEICKLVKQAEPKVMNQVIEQNPKIVVVMGHYGNFEWLCRSVMEVIPGFEHICLYQPVKNKLLDDYIRHNREKYGIKMVSVKDMKTLLQMTKGDTKQCIWFVMDQVPGAPHESAHWMEFLNQDTPVIYGPEKFAKRIGAAVVYAEIQQKMRGTYEVFQELISTQAKDTGEYEITEKQMLLLERGIKKHPALWLWSHNRWKHQRRRNAQA